MRLRIVFFVLYLLVLFKLLFFKVTLDFSDISISDNSHSSFRILLAGSNFIPLYRIYYYASGQEPYLVGLLNIVGNILLFIPMGFFLPGFFPRLKSARQILITVALMSLCVEVMQLVTITGEFDVDDILLNTLGAVIGYYLFRQNEKLVLRLKHNRGSSN